MSKKALFVIANSGFQDHEYGEPRRILKDAGILVEVASNIKGECVGAFGMVTEAEYTLQEVSGDDYDVVVMIGGPGAWQAFHKNEEYLRIAKEAKLLGAICIAPAIVSDSGLYNGIKVTGWDNAGEQIKHIENNGGIFSGESVTTSGKYITANGPRAATEFGEELVKMLENIH